MNTWPGRAHEGSLGRRAAELRLVSIEHSDGDTLSPHCVCWEVPTAAALPSPKQGRTLCTAMSEHVCTERVKLQIPGVVSTPEPAQ